MQAEIIQMIPAGLKGQSRRIWLDLGVPCVINGCVITVYLDRHDHRHVGRMRIQRAPRIDFDVLCSTRAQFDTDYGVYRINAIRWSRAGQPQSVLLEVAPWRRDRAREH